MWSSRRCGFPKVTQHECSRVSIIFPHPTFTFNSKSSGFFQFVICCLPPQKWSFHMWKKFLFPLSAQRCDSVFSVLSGRYGVKAAEFLGFSIWYNSIGCLPSLQTKEVWSETWGWWMVMLFSSQSCKDQKPTQATSSKRKAKRQNQCSQISHNPRWEVGTGFIWNGKLGTKIYFLCFFTFASNRTK